MNRVGALAEEQGHHPDILLAWGKAEITMWTHKIDGLTESDFIMAAKIDRLRDSIGAEARIICDNLRGAEAPPFHVTGRSQSAHSPPA